MLSNYCDKCGNCSRCGNCCTALLPITRKEEKIIAEYIKVHSIEPEYYEKDNSINLQCCFYDRKNKKCKIYDVRPYICRTFKCNRNEEKLTQERNTNQENSYWNRIDKNGKFQHLTDMRYLFYGDPRSLISNIAFLISNETLYLKEYQFEMLKQIMRDGGLTDIADSLKGEYE